MKEKYTELINIAGGCLYYTKLKQQNAKLGSIYIPFFFQRSVVNLQEKS